MKKTIIIFSFLLLLTSCNQNSWNTKKIENNKKETETTQKEENTNSWKTQENNNLKIKEKKEMTNKNIQKAPLEKGDLVAIMKTTNGTIKIKLFNKLVPNTVNNFVGLAKKWYYNGIIFHRVINNFMIQWGDPTGTGMWGESIYGEKFEDEFNPNLKNIKYSISMANAGPDTNGSQFFINQADNNYLDNKHSVFGQVIEWMENVDKIAKAKTGANDKPKKDIKIISVDIKEYDGEKLVDYNFDEKKAIQEYKDFLQKEKEAKKDHKIENWDVVEVNYTLTVDGKKVDSSYDRGQAFKFVVGAHQVIKWWDEGLLGHKIWDKFKLEVSPKDWYGEKEIKIEKSNLTSFIQAGIKLEKWETLHTAWWDFKILDADDKTITVENNNKLAGKTLNFDIEVVNVN